MSPSNDEQQPGDGERPFHFSDRRRIDPDTLSRRDVPAPGSTAADPGDPGNAAQPLTVTDSTALDEAQQEAAERTADLQRVTAEYANYRKRVDRDREAERTNAKAAVLNEMLTVLDDVDRAQAHGDLTGAFKTVADKLTGVLTRFGLAPLGTVGDPFDPARHEAVQFATSPEVAEQTVTSVFRPGYAIGDRLLRPAVVVVTGPEHEADAGDDAAPAEVVDGAVADGSGPADPA